MIVRSVVFRWRCFVWFVSCCFFSESRLDAFGPLARVSLHQCDQICCFKISAVHSSLRMALV